MAIPGSQQLAASAYRTLGLSGSATQGQIDQAARKLRIWPDPKTIPPTAWDLKWLGPVSRNKNDIEQALARLSEPATRVAERLMWFNGADPKPWSGTDASRIAAITAPASAPDQHDQALYRLHMASVRDPDLMDPGQWQDVLSSLRALAGSDEYLEWVADQENNGDFDKRARLEEIADELQKLPNSLTAGFITRAEAALENDDFVVAGRILELLKGCGPESGKSLVQIYDRAEDLLLRRCMRIHEDIQHQMRWERDAFTQEQDHNQGVCRELATVFNESIEPVVSDWDTFAPNQPERAERVRISAAKTQAALAQAWGWSGRFIIAHRTLRSALDLSRGSTLEAAIREDLSAYSRRARAEQAGYTSTGRKRIITTNPHVRIRPRAVPLAPAKPAGRFRLGWGATKIVICSIVLAIAPLIRLLTGPPSYSNDSTPSVQYPTFDGATQKWTLPPGTPKSPVFDKPPSQWGSVPTAAPSHGNSPSVGTGFGGGRR